MHLYVSMHLYPDKGACTFKWTICSEYDSWNTLFTYKSLSARWYEYQYTIISRWMNEQTSMAHEFMSWGSKKRPATNLGQIFWCNILESKNALFRINNGNNVFLGVRRQSVLIQYIFYPFAGPIASIACDKFTCRKCVIAGSVIACVGFVLSAQATELYQVYLAYGVISGRWIISRVCF